MDCHSTLDSKWDEMGCQTLDNDMFMAVMIPSALCHDVAEEVAGQCWFLILNMAEESHTVRILLT